MDGFILNMTDFVLYVTGFVLNMTRRTLTLGSWPFAQGLAQEEKYPQIYTVQRRRKIVSLPKKKYIVPSICGICLYNSIETLLFKIG